MPNTKPWMRASLYAHCKTMLENCGDTNTPDGRSILRTEDCADGHGIRIVGPTAEVEKAQAYARSLRSSSLPIAQKAPPNIEKNAAFRIIGQGGEGVRQLEQESGAWVRVQNKESPFTVEIFGEDSAVTRAEAIINERYSQDRME